MKNGYSLHIGINQLDAEHYDGWDGRLNACEYDAQDMKSLAANTGYQTNMLLTANATRKKVVEGIKAISKKTKAGDVFFLSYSGHGGRVADVDKDEEDGKDETWCLYDAQLLDDELYRLYATFSSGVRIIVLSDSCHSGTVTRAAITTRFTDSIPATAVGSSISSDLRQSERPSYRCMPPVKSASVYGKNRKFYDSLQKQRKAPEVKASVQLISGCQDNQYSLDGEFNGLFTGTLLKVWSNGSFDGDYRLFHKAIAKRMPPTQSPNHYIYGPNQSNFASQNPFEI